MTSVKPLSRIYFPGEIPPHGSCLLASEQAHHVARVLRLQPGDTLTLFDGNGIEYAAVIAHITKSGVTLNVGEPRRIDRESPLAVTLAQGISSGERMDYTVQKAVELGVAGIQPVESSRGVVRLDGMRAQKRVAHWQAVVLAACEQCGRNCVPKVAPVMRLRDWLGQAVQPPPSELRMLLSPQGPISLRELPKPRGSVVLLAGPEGGLTPEERHDAQRAGFTAVKLGPRVLRTETAAVAALAAMQTLWGDF